MNMVLFSICKLYEYQFFFSSIKYNGYTIKAVKRSAISFVSNLFYKMFYISDYYGKS